MITVGRIVHYYPPTVILGSPMAQPVAAIITQVHDAESGHVALECFGYGERVQHRGVPYSPLPKGGHWTWPPHS